MSDSNKKHSNAVNSVSPSPSSSGLPGESFALKRFFAKVHKTDSCWLWTGAKGQPLPYGLFWSGERYCMAHRFAYEAFVERIPDGMIVLHSCDNPPCVNPSHLRIGTHKENSGDMVQKNRQAKGEENGGHKLRAIDVVELRRQRAAGASYSVLVKRYGISKSQVARIVKGVSW